MLYIINTNQMLNKDLARAAAMRRGSEQVRTKKLFSIYPTTQECDIIVGQKIVGQKGVETDEKKLSK